MSFFKKIAPVSTVALFFSSVTAQAAFPSYTEEKILNRKGTPVFLARFLPKNDHPESHLFYDPFVPPDRTRDFYVYEKKG